MGSASAADLFFRAFVFYTFWIGGDLVYAIGFRLLHVLSSNMLGSVRVGVHPITTMYKYIEYGGDLAYAIGFRPLHVLSSNIPGTDLFGEQLYECGVFWWLCVKQSFWNPLCCAVLCCAVLWVPICPFLSLSLFLLYMYIYI